MGSRSRIQFVQVAIAFGLATLVASAGCPNTGDRATRNSTQGDAPVAASNNGVTSPARTDAAPRERPAAIVRFEPADREPASIYAEVVRKPREIRRGLMYRQHLPADEGMLFLMGQEEKHTFWMKNTLVALDIIFITRDMKVAGIIHHAKPMDRTSRGVGKLSLYVLEVNAGWTKQHGVGDGTPVTFENVALP